MGDESQQSGDLGLIGAAAGATGGNRQPEYRQTEQPQPQTPQRAPRWQQWWDADRHSGRAPEVGAGGEVPSPGDAVSPPGSAGASGEAEQDTPVRWGSDPWGRADEQLVQPFWLSMDMARRQLGMATLQLGRECGK